MKFLFAKKGLVTDALRRLCHASHDENASESEQKPLNLYAQNSESHGDRPEQDNDGERPTNGGGVAYDAAPGMEGAGNRSDIRVYAQGLETSRNEHSEHSERDRREAESERLVRVAKATGGYANRTAILSRGFKHDKKTGESEVILEEDKGIVYKIKNPWAKSPMKAMVIPEEAIFEHLVHNKYFPETAYTFEGISDDTGDLRIVLSQKFVQSISQPTKMQIDAALAEKGLRPEGRYAYGNDEVTVTDIIGDNALLGADGKVYFIDPIIDFKKPAIQILGKKS